MNSEDFIYGKGFHWFTGVIEDINDPEEMGRYKVRCFGYHTDNKEHISTEDLPWSHVMLPITSASMTGIGQSATGILQGTWVVGFFRDGSSAQDPLILGTLPSKSTQDPDRERGFNDPDGIYPRENYIGSEPDTPRAARKQYSDSQPYMAKEDLRQEEIETATPPRVTSISPDKDDAYYERLTWENRKLKEIIGPVYPANHVTETQSGHIMEVDDTPDLERLSTFHTSGTYEEVIANGDKTVTVVGDEYEVTFRSKNMYVKGNVNLTVDGNMKTLVKGNYHLEVEGDKTEYVKGNRVSKLGLNELIEVGSLDPDEGVPSDRLINVSGNNTTRIGGNEIRDVVKDSTTNITGHYNMNIVLDSKTVVNGHAAQTVIGTFGINSVGELSLISNASMNIATNDEFDLNSKNDITIAANNPDKVDGASGSIDIDGSRIDLN
jgi:hypothetical protein